MESYVQKDTLALLSLISCVSLKAKRFNRKHTLFDLGSTALLELEADRSTRIAIGWFDFRGRPNSVMSGSGGAFLGRARRSFVERLPTLGL